MFTHKKALEEFLTFQGILSHLPTFHPMQGNRVYRWLVAVVPYDSHGDKAHQGVAGVNHHEVG